MKALHRGKQVAKYYRQQEFWNERKELIYFFIALALLITLLYWTGRNDYALYKDGMI